MDNKIRPLNIHTDAEIAIFEAMQAVEHTSLTGEKLTEVVTLLGKARELLGEVVIESGTAPTVERGLSIGHQRVRSSFNPGASDIVSKIKNKSAELIDLCEPLKEKDGRLASLAQTSFEDAAMWAVKAAPA
ncbi:Acb2/Tad1 domain-containing protein [Flavobacterium sp. 3HN19-14]|uniref:Acb2/Tad1 domain-containing protein n=1 Tax=Flavobacterium sp. 3HN19-14 TaxID=3448133 RepID=UPI003EE200DB